MQHRQASVTDRPTNGLANLHKHPSPPCANVSSSADRARLSPARKPSAGAATRECSRWSTRSPLGLGALHCPCGWSGWSGQDPRAYPRVPLRAGAADQERRLPGGGQAAFRDGIGGRFRLRARCRAQGAPGTPARRAGQEGFQTRVRIVRTGCWSGLATCTIQPPLQATSAPLPFRLRLPYSRVDRDHRAHAGFADAAQAAAACRLFRPRWLSRNGGRARPVSSAGLASCISASLPSWSASTIRPSASSSTVWASSWWKTPWP